MTAFFEQAGRALAGAYMLYMVAFGLLGFYGLHALVLALLLLRKLPRFENAAAGIPSGLRRGIRVTLEIAYGLINPLIYLAIFDPYAAFGTRGRVDHWLASLAWVLLIALWTARVGLPRASEASPVTRVWLSRLCLIGIACLLAFAARDLLRLLTPGLFTGPREDPWLSRMFIVLVVGPLYLMPVTLLGDYRARLVERTTPTGLLLLSRRAAMFIWLGVSLVTAFTIALSVYRPSEAAVRARVEALQPAITAAASRYGVDAALVAAIVYVTQREQIHPFRDELERFATNVFLFDDASHLSLAKAFDFSIGVAQIKPITAVTAVSLCHAWDFNSKHRRDVPQLGPEWELPEDEKDFCLPPTQPPPSDKPELVSALLSDDGNVAFAALILRWYQQQWRHANPTWDIANRPEILATLYQIGFEKSHPHGAPRSNAFGDRVAAVSREAWLIKIFPLRSDG